MSENLAVRSAERAYHVEDLTIRSDGSGRVVEAYAAVFNRKTEIHDFDGHYHEEIDPKAFNRTMAHKGTSFGVLFNHGRTVDGEPNPAATMPIGVPLEVRADENGLFTATRYLDNPLADNVLDAIKHKAIKAQSFSGRFLRSVKRPAGRARGDLPTITRHEIDMREYGPAVFAAYTDAVILGTRTAAAAIRAFLALPPEERVLYEQHYELGVTPQEPAHDLNGTPTGLADSVDSHSHSDRSSEIADKLKAFRARLEGK